MADREAVWVYVTAATREDALRIARALVAERLCACVNVLGAMTSVYRWRGEVKEDPEVAFVAKTTRPRLDALVERVKALHPYECPCVVALPIVGGNPAFVQWIAEESEPPKE